MNLEEVAKEAGVSRSTVSRVINNDPKVRHETRLHVREVIQRLNYQPNVVARSLAGGKTNVIGLVIPMGVTRLFADPYFPVLIQGVSMACSARDHSVMLWLAEPEFERRTIHQVMHNQIIDGVIIASTLLDDPLVDALNESSLPFILVGRHLYNPNISYIDVDNQASAEEVVFYLKRMGYKRIATIAGPQNMIAGIDRLEGYKAALRQWGTIPDPDLIIEGDFTVDGGRQAMLRLIDKKPDAVFIASDAMAIGALRTLDKEGIKVPDEIGIVSFDDLPIAARANPPLTTIRQPIKRTGALAAKTLIEMINEPDPNPRRIVLPTELVIRGSCGSEVRSVVV